MNLQTKYLGLDLKHPITAGASPLTQDLDKVRELEDGGVSAITMYSLFEEQISHNLIGSGENDAAYDNTFHDTASSFEEVDLLDHCIDDYLDHMQQVKSSVDVPVIGSINGTREGEWVKYASLMEQAGADALELNLYFLPVDLDESSADIEERCVRIVESVGESISIPLAVKLSPFFTALPQFSKRLVNAGAKGLVCFNRFNQPDVDMDELEVRPMLNLSHPNELRIRLRWIALLSKRIEAQLAVSGGVHTGIDCAKSLLVGADVVQVVSHLLKFGPSSAQGLVDELTAWMQKKEFDSLNGLRGAMNYLNSPDPEAFERANYMRSLKSWSEE